MTIRINGSNANSGVVVLPSTKDYAEILVKDVFFKLVFEDDGEKPSAILTKKNEEAVFTFKNFSDPLGLSFSVEIPLTSGGKVEIIFAIYSIGKGSERSVLVNYTYRDVK